LLTQGFGLVLAEAQTSATTDFGKDSSEYSGLTQ
jgi:hypothetical protein